MFDNITCKVPLPDGRPLKNSKGKYWDFQTKDLECCLFEYIIEKDKTLYIKKYNSTDVPEEERPYYGKKEWATPFYQIVGSVKRTYKGKKKVYYTGKVDFYTNMRGDVMAEGNEALAGEWIEYRAKFKNGILKTFRRKKDYGFNLFGFFDEDD